MARRANRADVAPEDKYYVYSLLRKAAEGLAILTGRLADGASTFLPVPVAEWVDQNVPAAATAASATHAAGPAGSRHYVTGLSGSYGAAQVGTMRLLAGAAVLGTFHVHNQRDVEFEAPIEIPPDTAITADLSAGAAGIVGAVVVRGYTIEA
jgi:hypothetical protein